LQKEQLWVAYNESKCMKNLMFWRPIISSTTYEIVWNLCHVCILTYSNNVFGRVIGQKERNKINNNDAQTTINKNCVLISELQKFSTNKNMFLSLYYHITKGFHITKTSKIK